MKSRPMFALRIVALLGALLAAVPAVAAGNPDFDAVTWAPLTCDASPLISHASPAAVDFVGDANFPPVYFAHDGNYLYFRYRVDGDPSGPGGFAQYSWTALMQVPSGNAFQYQYQLSLNGDSDTIEVWHNTVAKDVDFSSTFHDPAEVKLFSQGYTFSDGSTANSTPLARRLTAGDGSHFGNSADYFVDFAFPVSALIANGVISSAADLDSALFFPATSTNPSNYNKGFLNCPFLPEAHPTAQKTVAPTAAPVNVTTSLVYTIAVQNPGLGTAKGITVQDPALPAFMSNVVVTVSADPGVTWTVESENPLLVKVPALPSGASVTIQISADASPSCSTADFMNVASLAGVNVVQLTGSALLQVSTGPELCDGVDNDCNGQVDEGSLCNDGNHCTTDACTAGACVHTTPDPTCVACATDGDCDDANACTTDSCSAGDCMHTTPDPTCVPCTSATECDDANGCTTDACTAGACTHDTPDPTCVPCSSSSECDDGNGCTTDACPAGACIHDMADPSCVPCSSAAQCDDGNACTTDACTAGACVHDTPDPTCVPCASAAQCDDGNGCTTDACTAGTCTHATPDPTCVPCSSAAQCDDGNGCTIDVCTAGTCMHMTPDPACIPCTNAHQCADGNGCTMDMCNASGVCEHPAQAGCIPCASASDCDDHNPCTSQDCAADGSCMITFTSGCQHCTTASDCDDGDSCTIERCTGGVCVHDRSSACAPLPEICDDGSDNDGDGLVDCDDPDCASAPTCGPREICGNCIDDDGDGLVDYDDPDCCDAPMAMDVRRLKLKPGPKAHGNRLKLKTRWASTAPMLFDPMTQDTSIQIADANGQVFCATVGAQHWKHPRRAVYKFKDKAGAFAGGLGKGRFKVKRSGKVMFSTRGKKMILPSMSAGDVRVTLRVGGLCAKDSKTLRTTKKALVFP